MVPATSSLESDKILSIMDIGMKFTYQIPSFPITSVDLREIKIQVLEENGSILLCDGFIRADGELEKRVIPFSIKLHDCCVVPVEEVAKNMERLSPLPNNEGFLVIWHWADEDMYDTPGSFKQELRINFVDTCILAPRLIPLLAIHRQCKLR